MSTDISAIEKPQVAGEHIVIESKADAEIAEQLGALASLGMLVTEKPDSIPAGDTSPRLQMLQTSGHKYSRNNMTTTVFVDHNPHS